MPLRFRLALAVALLLPLAGCGDADEAYPSRPVTYIVPWNAGGGTDTASRALAAVLGDALGEPVNVVNRTGGGGVVGHLAIAQAPTDGHTVGAVTAEVAMMHWLGMTELTPADYRMLAILLSNAAAVTVRADAPWETVPELLADVRANPGEFQASGTARGGIWDVARIGMLGAAGLEETALPWVPSQGAAPALQELLAGGVDVVTASLAETDALRKAGEVKTLAVMADERLDAAPDVPTLKEQGIDWSLGSWVGVGAPADLAEPAVAVLDSALAVAVQDPRYREPLERAGFRLDYRGPAEAQAFAAEQDELFGRIMEDAGLAR